jgi:serine/threonine protein kinase/Tol biopolymer transport system component
VSESERWARVKTIFDAAVACPAGDRPGLLREMCGDDAGLQANVESLLAADAENPSSFAPSVDGGTRGRVFDAVADVLDARTAGLSPGDRLGDYEIRGVLGAGGMGRAYRARDLTLGRDVGLKILSSSWLTDKERAARFEREARVLASLNHPNIGSIYGVISNDGGAATRPSVKALVLELVEGQTLAERLTRQAAATPSRPGLPLHEVVAIAGQLIDAIEAAHEHGIVHRDLKPANIKVTPEGRVKVLDFGLARLMSASGERDADPAAMAAGVTQNGALLGTAPYMSPEQARGRTVDKRSDIWAFGCVLYEILAGTAAFVGDSTADLLANVVTVEPDWSALPTGTSPALRLCVQRCLQKDLRQRFHDIADVRLAMEGAFEPPASGVTRNRRPFLERYAPVGWAAAAVTIVATLALVEFPAADPPEPLETRLEIVTPPAADPLSLAISPDGRSVVFQAGRDLPQLWLRRLDSADARPIAGTEGALYPFWSPDSRSVGFSAGRVVKRVDLDSGVVRTVANRVSVGGAWAPDGTILLGSGIGPLHRGRAEGGALTTATALLDGQNSHRWPQFLPDGRFLLFVLGVPETRGLYLGSTAEPVARRVADREAGYRFMPPAHVLFARDGGLWARQVRSDLSIVEEEPLPVAPKVLVDPNVFGYSAFSTSSTGSIAYRAAAAATRLVWLDRAGRQVGTLGQPDDSQMMLLQASRDGRAIAVTRTIEGRTNVWLVDTERGTPRRLTFDVNDNAIVISPEGDWIAHQATGPRDGSVVYRRRSDGTGTATVLLEESVDEWHQPMDWSGDGRYIVFAAQTPTGVDLRVLPVSGGGAPFELAATPFAEFHAKFSPDSRWVAFVSTETGRAEVYVQAFPGTGPKRQVSEGGGTWPRWRRDASELFYLSADGRLMSVPIVRQGASLETATPRALFALKSTSGYEASPDGQRFLVTAVVSEASPISVILNWKPPRP